MSDIAELSKRARAATMGFDWADLPDDALIQAVPLLREIADALWRLQSRIDAAEPVRVKALEWPQSISRGQRVKSRGVGLTCYTIAHYGGSDPNGAVVYRWAREASPWSAPFHRYEDAQAAAQVDYDALVRSALTLLPKPGEADGALVEALTEARAVIADADEELRLIRAKDCGVVYDTTLRHLKIPMAYQQIDAALLQHTRSKALSDLAEIDRDLLGKEGAP